MPSWSPAPSTPRRGRSTWRAQPRLRGRHREMRRPVHGCGQHPEIVKDDHGPGQLGIDTATNTVYAADQGNPNCRRAMAYGDGNRRQYLQRQRPKRLWHPPCVASGNGVSRSQSTRPQHGLRGQRQRRLCDRRRTLRLGESAGFTTPPRRCPQAPAPQRRVDPQDHTVLRSRRATTRSRRSTRRPVTAPRRARALAAPSQREAEVGPGAAHNDLIVTPGNATAYAVNEGGANVLRVTSISGCSALEHSACLVQAPRPCRSRGLLPRLTRRRAPCTSATAIFPRSMS